MSPSRTPVSLAQPTFVELFTPKLVTVLREGYGVRDIQRDALAGLTVAIVALPLSMAIAIASGVSPDRGLYTAIIGGFIVSLLGGSRFQVAGPAGAFIVLVASVVERHGYDGLVLATIMAGLMMLALGLLRGGTYVKYIPFPVTVGFTAGIAVIIFASQLKDALGLKLDHEPSELMPKLKAIWGAIGGVDGATVAIAALTIAVIEVLRKLRPSWPSFLIAITLASAAAALLHLDVATVGSRFGALANSLPAPSFPSFSFEKIQALLPDAVAIALLGSIESLLSAVVADGMSGSRHRSNCELAAQGVANVASALFGGICVTGTIARTATNVRSGARGPIAGMFHSLYLLAFLMIAAPLVGYIPLAALAGVLIVVAWHMTEKDAFRTLIVGSRGDAVVLLATFLLTIFVDLITGIGVGVVLGSLLFLHRMAETVEVRSGTHFVSEDVADGSSNFDPDRATARDVMVYRISGAFFFGATARVTLILERLAASPKAFVLDFTDVPLINSSGAYSLHAFAARLQRNGTKVYFAATRADVRKMLELAGLKPPHVTYVAAASDVRAPKSKD